MPLPKPDERVIFVAVEGGLVTGVGITGPALPTRVVIVDHDINDNCTDDGEVADYRKRVAEMAAYDDITTWVY